MAVENIEREQFRRTPRSFLLTILIIIVGTLICAGVFVFTTDGVCQRNAAEWLPRYPDSVVLAESKTFLNTFGMGITQVTLSTPDTPNDVRRWYNEERGKNGATSGNLLATMNYSVRDSENGGSTILLYSECAWR
jgi:hypothetical protein